MKATNVRSHLPGASINESRIVGHTQAGTKDDVAVVDVEDQWGALLRGRQVDCESAAAGPLRLV